MNDVIFIVDESMQSNLLVVWWWIIKKPNAISYLSAKLTSKEELKRIYKR